MGPHLHQVTRVLDDGTEEVLLDNTKDQPRRFSPETTWYINDMLKNVVTREIRQGNRHRGPSQGMTGGQQDRLPRLNNLISGLWAILLYRRGTGWAITAGAISSTITRLCPP